MNYLEKEHSLLVISIIFVNIWTWIPEGKREKGTENVSEEITAENFPNLKKNRYSDKGSIEGPKQYEPK